MRDIFINLLILFILFCYSENGYSQKYKFKTFSVDEGLSQSYVYDLIQDKKGYLWICTAEGLNRFDGIDFRAYTVDDSIAENFVTAGCIDISGNLWFGHNQGGISFYDGRNFKVISAGDSVSSAVNDIITDRSGIVWMLVQNEGIIRIDKDQRIMILKSEEQVLYYSINILKSGELLVGTSSGLYICETAGDTSKPVVLKPINDIPPTKIQCIYKTKDEDVFYIGTEDEGLLEISFKKSTSNPEVKKMFDGSGLTYENVQDVLVDKESYLWIATGGNGIFKIGQPYTVNSKKIVHYNIHNGLIINHIRNLFTDVEGNIWAGTYGGGFVLLNSDYFEFDYRDDEKISNNTFSIFLDNDYKWYGVENGLVRKDPNSRDAPFFYSGNNGFPKAKVTAIDRDYKGTLWVGTDKAGIYFLNSSSQNFTRFNLSDDVLQNSINSIACDSSYVWVATLGGLFSIDLEKRTKKYFGSRDGLPNNNVKHLITDKGGVWAVCYGKDVCVINNNKISKLRITLEDEILDVASITKDNNGTIWIATYGNGVFRFKPSASLNLSVEHGLFSDYCYSIISDNDGYIWVGHRSGLSRVNPFDLSINTFSKEEGIKNECNFNSVFKDNTGSVLFGTTLGLVKYDPEKNKRNLTPPQLNITSVKFSDKEADFSGGIDYPYDIYKLRIDFIGISFKNPDKVTYQYKLEGYDLGWSDFQENRYVQYNRIEDGNYTFILKACNSDGICVETPLELNIRIRAPFWKTWWFISLMVVTVILGIYIFFKIRLSRIERQKKILEEQVRERTSELVIKNKEIEIKNIELEKLSIVASGTDNSVIIANPDGEIEWVNEGFTRLLGYTFDEFKQLHGTSLIGASSNKDFGELFRICTEEKRSVIYSVQSTTKSGKKIWVRTTLSPILDVYNQVKNVVAIDSDITAVEEEKERVEIAKKIIEKKNKNITDSINYAKLIQQSILPTKENVEKMFKDSFILYKPKDIVSGDFYWMTKVEEKIVFAVADCTGHGVPGAFMSMLGSAFLSEIVDKGFITNTSEILNRLRKEIIRVLQQNVNEEASRFSSFSLLKDGMDISIITIDTIAKKVQFSGAYNSLYIIRSISKKGICDIEGFESGNKVLYELKGDKMPIGIHDKMEKYSSFEFTLEKGDYIYLLTDGIADQFGGPFGKKFKYEILKNLLLDNCDKPFSEQKNKLDEYLVSWMNTLNIKTNENYEQVDDITVVGFML